MASVVQICNLALSNLGASAISSLNDSSKGARECSLRYETVRDSVLADHDWGFARKRLSLAQLTTTYSGWDYAYQLPIDCLVAREIYDGTGSASGYSYNSDLDAYVQAGKVEFEIATNSDLSIRMLLTDKEDAELKYTAKVSDPNVFTPIFIEALSLKLASDLAQPLKGSLALKDALIQSYLAILGRAQFASANEGYKKPEVKSPILDARD